MNAIGILIGAYALHLLGWSLLHFLWQAALLALLLRAVLVAVQNHSAQTRYLLCCATLALMALCPAGTLAYLAHHDGSVPSMYLQADAAGAAPVVDSQPLQTASLLSRFAAMADQFMPWILAIWITGVLLLLARAVLASLAAQRLKTASTIPPSAGFLALATRVGKQLGITQHFQVFASQAVTSPTVIGWLKPVILFPVASLTGLAPEQLEAMLAHELAHIRRHDYLVNALQVAMETLLFYHPAVWWVSRQIRRERELCCDDVAVAVTGSPLAYAKALYLLEEQRSMEPQFILGSNGGQLKMRIQRLLTGKQPATGSYGGASWLLTITLLLATAGLAVSTVIAGKAQAQSPAATAPQAATVSATGHEISWGEAMKHLQPRTPPKYPEMAKAAHVSGTVRIALTISAQGDVTEAHVVSGPEMLRQSALDAVIHYKFSPFSDGPVNTTTYVIYSLGESSSKPDLSCTYYDANNVGHNGTCELQQTNGAPQYLCRQIDWEKQAQLQIGCKEKVEAAKTVTFNFHKKNAKDAEAPAFSFRAVQDQLRTFRAPAQQ